AELLRAELHRRRRQRKPAPLRFVGLRDDSDDVRVFCGRIKATDSELRRTEEDGTRTRHGVQARASDAERFIIDRWTMRFFRGPRWSIMSVPVRWSYSC